MRTLIAALVLAAGLVGCGGGGGKAIGQTCAAGAECASNACAELTCPSGTVISICTGDPCPSGTCPGSQGCYMGYCVPPASQSCP